MSIEEDLRKKFTRAFGTINKPDDFKGSDDTWKGWIEGHLVQGFTPYINKGFIKGVIFSWERGGKAQRLHVQFLVHMKNGHGFSDARWAKLLPGSHRDYKVTDVAESGVRYELSDLMGMNYVEKNEDWRIHKGYDVTDPRSSPSEVFLKAGVFESPEDVSKRVEEGSKKGAKVTKSKWTKIFKIIDEDISTAIAKIMADPELHGIAGPQMRQIEGHINRARLGQIKDHSECQGMWLYGDTATGKTTYAKQFAPNAYRMINGCIYFEGFNNESEMIIDDMTPENFKKIYPILLELGRGAAANVQVKGSWTRVAFKVIIVSSNYSIPDICKLSNIPDATVAALLSRFPQHHFTRSLWGRPFKIEKLNMKTMNLDVEYCDGDDDLRQIENAEEFELNRPAPKFEFKQVLKVKREIIDLTDLEDKDAEVPEELIAEQKILEQALGMESDSKVTPLKRQVADLGSQCPGAPKRSRIVQDDVDDLSGSVRKNLEQDLMASQDDWEEVPGNQQADPGYYNNMDV